ncbi:molybdopterin-dependent oxidoreductase [Sulfurimonas diazotrophicus]|uniref:Molybdopterin-dependent oxidoreductase n=1 Tax=Sulfurimonas diazotrophicus TaxID=3131939 RepID=A0ABZ3HDJ0_9BACT
MQKKTACPLDCYDACSVIVDAGKLKGDKLHPYTHGYLCPHLNHFKKRERIAEPKLRGEVVSMETALAHLETLVRDAREGNGILHYRSSGNFGLMQGVTDHFFASVGAALTKGSLCDGAGEAGVVEGRGANRALPPEQIAEADVVMVWGRNVPVTNSHLLPFLKGKELIVVDPVRTAFAESADIHIQLKPGGDLYFAMLLARFIVIEGMYDAEYLAEHGEAFEEYYELTQTVRIKAALDSIGLGLGDIGRVLERLKGKKVAILVGTGVQKYRHGDEVLRAIDAIGTLLGLFGKPGCGVSFLGSSSSGIPSPFAAARRFESKAAAAFSDYDLVFVQGANPVAQMPDTRRVVDSLSKAGHVVYFGLYENETSAMAELVIPAKTFLEKRDVRTAYGHNAMLEMPECETGETGISEYALCTALCTAFDVPLESEAYYLEHFLACGEAKDDKTLVKGREALPYAEGFDTDDGQFLFLEEYDFDFDMEEDYFLVSPKSPRSLNSQFDRESRVFMHPECGFEEGASVRLVSEQGSLELPLAYDDRLLADCVLVYAGTPGVNNLTTSLRSFAGENACYQANKIKVEAC